LLQSSFDDCAHLKPLTEPVVVYRGISSGGRAYADLFNSMVSELVVLPSFTSTSLSRRVAIEKFAKAYDGVLLEIDLHPGDIATHISDCSDYPYETEILIAASSVFRVIAVDTTERLSDSRGLVIPRVRLSYEMSWFEIDIDKLPPTLLV
jgi:hypothetical protein